MKTKLPTPQRLPSGMYRCRVMVDGIRVSVVEDDPNVAQAKAIALKNGLMRETKPVDSITVGDAIDRYIASKDAVLSPSTIMEYKRMRKNKFAGLISVKLKDLTQEKVQKEVNSLSKSNSPKSVRNAHGLLTAALTEFYPSLVLRTTLPQKQRFEVKIPSDDEISAIMKASIGTDIELPVALAIWLGLRMSEILGLTWECINDDNIRIKQARVTSENGTTLKGTKTYSGTRTLHAPQYILDLIVRQPKNSEFIVPYDRHGIYKRFSRLCKNAGLPHYRFHDLRHANASVMLALNVPDKYAMERMGHATNNMLKTVYQHTMKSKQDEVAELVDNYFNSKLDTNLDTKK